MNNVPIICPSRKRAKSVITNIKNMILCVDEKEYDEYKANNKFKIITHSGLKNLSEIRQYLYSKYGDIFMVDDDIQSVELTYQTTDSILSPEKISKVIQKTYHTAKSLNAFLWGFNNDPSPTHYNQHKPFMANGYINGCAFGLLKNKHLYFDKNTVACESHWINLLNAYHNRYCFIDKRFHFRQKSGSTFLLVGGQTGKRTMVSEQEDTLFLKKTFGDSVKLKKAKNKTLQLHEFQRELDIKL